MAREMKVEASNRCTIARGTMEARAIKTLSVAVVCVGSLVDPGGVRNRAFVRLSNNGTSQLSTPSKFGEIFAVLGSCISQMSLAKARTLPYLVVYWEKEGLVYCIPQSMWV